MESTLMNLVILEFLLNLGYLGYFITNSFLAILEILLYLGYLGYFGKNCLLGYLHKTKMNISIRTIIVISI